MHSDYDCGTWEYEAGRTDGERRARKDIAGALTAMRKESKPETQAVIDALAKRLGFGTKTEVSYTA